MEFEALRGKKQAKLTLLFPLTRMHESDLPAEVHAGITTAALTAAAAMQHANHFAGMPYAPSYILAGERQDAASSSAAAHSAQMAQATQAMYLLQPPHVLQQLAAARRMQTEQSRRPPAMLAPLHPRPPLQQMKPSNPDGDGDFGGGDGGSGDGGSGGGGSGEGDCRGDGDRDGLEDAVPYPGDELSRSAPAPRSVDDEVLPHDKLHQQTKQLLAELRGAQPSEAPSIAPPLTPLSTAPNRASADAATAPQYSASPHPNESIAAATAPSSTGPVRFASASSDVSGESASVAGLTDAKALAMRLAEAEAEIAEMRVELAIAKEKAESFKALALAKDEIIKTSKKQTSEWQKYATQALASMGAGGSSAGKEGKKEKKK